MTRLVPLVLGVLAVAWLADAVSADDPPKKLTAEERKELEVKWKERNDAGLKAYPAGRHLEAVKLCEEALGIARRLYPKAEYPDGHNTLATSLNNLGFLYQAQGRYADAEPHLREALAMRRRLFKGDHPDVATSMSNLAELYRAQGKYGDAEPLCAEALAMRRRLFRGDHPAVARGLGGLAELYRALGRYDDAEPLCAEALAMRRRMHPGDHPDVARSMTNLGSLYEAQGRSTSAELLLREALEMRRRLFKGDHPDVANGLNNLGCLYWEQGRYAAAEPLFREALEMRRRLFKGDHPGVATSMSNLAGVYKALGRYADAESLDTDVLAMRKRMHPGDHPSVATTLGNLAELYRDQGRYAAAGQFHAEALDMYKRLFKGDHPFVARGLNNLAVVYWDQGKYDAAGRLDAEALDMYRRLFKGDHPLLVVGLGNLAGVYNVQGRYADAGPLLADTLAMSRRLATAFARRQAEGEALSLLASTPRYRDAFLSNERHRGADLATVYPVVWADKGALARVYEQRQLQARAVADPALAKVLSDLTAARRRRAELLLAPATGDPTTLERREADLKALDDRIRRGNEAVPRLLPVVARSDRLDATTPADLRNALPADTAVVDYIRSNLFESDKDKPGKSGRTLVRRYLAFVVTKEKVAWADLGTADAIETAVAAWRAAIDTSKEVPAALPARVRELVWEKVRKELPAGVKTVYVCPDAALCRVPWAALPGDKPGTILLEDYALATIPHAPFLLDKLWPQDPVKNPPVGALVVGGVKYDADVAPPAGAAVASRGEPLLKPGQKLGWGFLPNTVGESRGVAAAAGRKNLPVTVLEGDATTAAAVLAALPRARFAHFATHGFFADPSFRSVFDLDEKDYERGRWGDRVGRAANSPLVMTGLVLAGANNPKTPGRGILTGEGLIDLDLSGLELAVLSACETGLGDDVTSGEGTFGLQRAFHYAGARDVVASLWKVPDGPTAALMGLFYRNLWEKNLPPAEALRQAQLEVYRNPGKIAEMAKGFRGTFDEVPGSSATAAPQAGGGTAHPLLWAAFTLSGPGR
jgi:CHAT domain-containing protein/tetratricopeptide (TPR) repeat protein